jgi:magnesium chelatase subunit I
MPSREYLAGLEQIAPLREAAALLAKTEEPAMISSAIEFLLEGLHLSNKLNKIDRDHGARYARP